MTIPRIYCKILLRPEIEVSLPIDASHHVSQVLRCKTGELIVVFNANDGEFNAKILSIQRKVVIIKVLTMCERSSTESPLRVHLGQVISRGERMDYAIQKAVELGVTEITPLLSEYCNIKLDPERANKRIAHWQKIVISACEQSGRLHIPQIHAVKNWQAWLAQAEGLNIICSPTAKSPAAAALSTCISQIKPPIKSHTHAISSSPLTRQPKPPFCNLLCNINLLIGAEGGFTEAEVTSALQDYHCVELSLGPRILRTETATVVALTLLQHHWGDL